MRVEGAVHGVQHRRQLEHGAKGDEQEPRVVVDHVEVAVGPDLRERMRKVARVEDVIAEGSAIIAVCGSGKSARSSAGVRELPEANSTTS